jgi:gliding motility-associated-like protein
MKKLLLITLFFAGCFIVANAQPANDDCSTAQNLGALPPPAACPGAGLGVQLNIPGTIVGATEASPYLYQPGCSGAGGPNMGVPAFDVWYSFVATGYQMQLTVNSTFANPNVAMYSGTCGALGGGVGGCAVGTGGTVSLTVEQMVPGTTYYIQVSGNTGQTGTFNLLIQNNRDCSDCLNASHLVINPVPVNGMYQPGQVVNFCYTIDGYTQINTNWLHGIQITFGAGWAGISGQVPPASVGASGTWGWFPSCTSTATGTVFGQGFYMDLDNDGNPGNNFGDNCGVPSNTACPLGTSWTFCWNMTVAPGCSPGSNLDVTVNTSGDGESGSWSNVGCIDDPASVAPAVGACCPPNMAAVNISCPGMNDGQATATPLGAASPYNYTWNGPGGYVNTTNGVAGANTITNLSASGVYTVSLTDNLNCLTTATVTVNVGAGTLPVPANTGPYCEGATINLSVGAGFVDWDWTGPGGYVQNNMQNPTIGSSTPAMTGLYTVIVTNAGGCTGTATTNVTVNALPIAVANNTGPYCPGALISLSSGGGVDYDWTGPLAYNQPNTQNPNIPGASMGMGGIYTVTVTTAANCSATATTTVVVNAGVPAVANNTGPYCTGSAINLTTPNGAIDYDWIGPNGYVQNNTQNPIIPGAALAMAGDYTVTVTYAGGCTSTGTTTVAVYNSPTAQFTGNPLNGCAPMCVDLTDQSLGNGGIINNWLWNIQGQIPIASQNPNVCFNSAGAYDVTLTVTTTNGCSATLTIPDYINVSPVPVASFIYTPQTIMELHPDVTFASNSIGATSWLWDFGDGAFSNTENPIHPYADTGIFCITLLVTNNAGCADTTVGCLYIQPEYSLYIPNAFTVNGDGLNEMWQLYGRGVTKLEVRIFDRWGEEIYFFDDLEKGWPGTKQNGSVCKQDVYVFRVVATDPSNNEHTILGRVTLLK